MYRKTFHHNDSDSSDVQKSLNNLAQEFKSLKLWRQQDTILK